MDTLSQISAAIAMSMCAAWASGLNLYATLLTLGILGRTHHMVLPADLNILMDPLVIGASGVMFLVEFVADKVPGVDSSWDALHTFIRIPAGAVLAASAIGDVSPVLTLVAGILGGGISAGTHAAKAGTRVLINASPEPFSNWAASFTEDVAVIAGVWAAINHPIVFLALLVCFLILLAWALPRLWRGIKKLFQGIARLFGRRGTEPTQASSGSDHSG